MKPYIAEVLGTCILTFSLIIATTLGPWIGSIIAAFILMFVVYTMGHISGAHINPAITLGALSIGKIRPFKALHYILAQIAGAALAVTILHYTKISSPSDTTFTFSWLVLFAEIIGMAIFAFGVASVVYKRGEFVTSGFVVGLSLFIGLIVSLLLIGNSGGSAFLNPAVAFGLGGFGITSLIGPIIGSVIGMWVYSYLSEDVRSVIAGSSQNFKAN